MLRTVLLAALVGGALAGVLATGLQAFRVVPLILAAETYEQAEATPPHGDAGQGQAASDAEGWAPETALQRTLATTFANLLTGIGFALLLAAALTLTGGTDWHHGLLWGLGGYAAFVLAPSISLPPSVPGMPEAHLEARQLWWLGTVVATAAGLYLLIRVRLWYGAVLGALGLLLPHLIGAPAPVAEQGPVPAEIVHAFRSTTQATNLVFWLVLGSVTGFLLGRLSPTPAFRA
ncbi:MAG TPA: CbtA family protein [Geminicoccaceae bacterium]|nr:CbtA family protein [Geminicoccaceae bacterium]